MSDRQTLARVIKNTAVYYGRPIEPEVLTMMVDDLTDLPFDQVIWAYEVYRKNPKNRAFPLPAQIREIVTPNAFISPEDQSAEIAGRIVGAVSTFGWNNAKDAEKFIGPSGWSVVQRQGGWSYICENLGLRINASTFQAQLRKQLEVSLKYGDQAVAESIGAPQKRGGDLISASEVIRKLNPAKEPEGAA